MPVVGCFEQMFEEIRNRHFSNVSSFLSEKARALQTGYDVRKSDHRI